MLEELFNQFYKLDKQQAEHYSSEITQQMNLIETEIWMLLNNKDQTELDYYRDLLTSTNLEIKMSEQDLEYLKRKQKYYSSKITLIFNNIDNEVSKKMSQ